MSAISRRIVRELADPEFREAYKRSRVRTKIAFQIKALRKQRDWLQGKLAAVMGKPQSTVSRFEDVDYGKLSLETLFEISDAFDLGLIVEFVSYPEFMIRTSNLEESHLVAPSYSEKSMQFLVSGTQRGVSQASASIPAVGNPGAVISGANPSQSITIDIVGPSAGSISTIGQLGAT